MAIDLKVGINSYVSLEEANTYIQEHYPDFSPEYTSWFNSGISEDNKKALLISSTSNIDNLLRFRGRKCNVSQALQFPRVFSITNYPVMLPILFYSQYYDNTLISGGSSDDSNGLPQAKEATIVNTVAGMILNPKLKEETNIRVLSGLTSKREGNISATFDSSDENTQYLMQGIYNIHQIRSIFKSWLSSSITSL